MTRGVEVESVAKPRVRLCQVVAWWLGRSLRDMRASMEDCAVRLGHRNRGGVISAAINIAVENSVIVNILWGCGVGARV